MTTRKIMVTPCMVKIWLYFSAVSSFPFGRASCERISSASTPPIRKNTKEVKKYRTPIRLWSTVVIQPQKPAVEVGRRKMRLSLRTTGSITVSAISPPGGHGDARTGSLEALQISDQRFDLPRRQRGPAGLIAGPDGHVVARLHGLGVAKPVGQVLGRALEDCAGERRPGPEVGQVRADRPDHPLDAGERVAPAAARGLQPGHGLPGGLSRRRPQLLLDPCVELRRRLG